MAKDVFTRKGHFCFFVFLCVVYENHSFSLSFSHSLPSLSLSLELYESPFLSCAGFSKYFICQDLPCTTLSFSSSQRLQRLCSVLRRVDFLGFLLDFISTQSRNRGISTRPRTRL